MNKKNDIKDLLNQRTPLTPNREVVTPVDMYTNPQTDKSTSGQESSAEMPSSDAVQMGGGRVVHKPTKPQVEKYTTHLRPDTIKALKRIAFEHDIKDYEVVQQALDEYMRKIIR